MAFSVKSRTTWENLGFPCNIICPVSWRACAKCQAVCSPQLQPVPFFQVALRGAAERWQECSVWLSSLWSSAALFLTVWFAQPFLTVPQCNFHRNMVKWWLENIHGNADLFLSIIHPWLWNSLPFLVLHILFSQKMAKTETYDTNPRTRILLLRYSYEKFCC